MKFLIHVRKKILTTMTKACVLTVCSFISGYALVLVFVLLLGYRIYIPLPEVSQFPSDETLYLEKIGVGDYCDPEAFTEEERVCLLGALCNAKANCLFRTAEAPPLPFFSETLDSPFYAVKAVVPFSHSYFLFDKDGCLLGAQLSEADLECVSKIIRATGDRLGKHCNE